jgi:hypothetical protein
MIAGASVRPAVTTPQVPLAPCKRAANPCCSPPAIPTALLCSVVSVQRIHSI